ncbi:hypothetical protein O181_091356 [Austropuccinia psidii MF-1]|uniref:Chromo domain-containing protein n=1 Tax=Austropuccinia psidii MF-1 TaxID=1389203 RepID=A0A9Q3IXD5_9BASI|nr:hypothetical protein [Austropuccinia psidii MF-1]
MYVSYYQDDWKPWLPMSEFAYNNSDHSSTIQLPFLTVYGGDPHLDSAQITQNTPAGKLLTKFQTVQKDVKRELEVAIDRFKRYANKSRASPPVFNCCEMVWISSKSIKSKRPPKKTFRKIFGFFSNLEESQYSCLPPQWKSIHPVFHISLLKPVKKSTIPNRHQGPLPPIFIEEEEEWEVSQILYSKIKRRKSWYLVEWKGFSQDPETSTWEPTENLKNCSEPVNNFHFLYPDKPGPNCSKLEFS